MHDSARSRIFEFDLVTAWSMPWAKFAELIYPNILGHISIKVFDLIVALTATRQDTPVS